MPASNCAHSELNAFADMQSTRERSELSSIFAMLVRRRNTYLRSEQVAQKYYAAPVPKPTPTPSPTPMPGPAPAPTPTPTPAPPNAAYRAQLATVIEALGANAKSEFLASTTDNMSTTDLYAVYSQVVNKYYKPTPTPTPAPTPTPTPAPTPTPTANNGTYRQQLASDIEYLAGSQWKTTFLSRTSDSDSTDQLLAQRNAVLADWAATV